MKTVSVRLAVSSELSVTVQEKVAFLEVKDTLLILQLANYEPHKVSIPCLIALKCCFLIRNHVEIR